MQSASNTEITCLTKESTYIPSSQNNSNGSINFISSAGLRRRAYIIPSSTTNTNTSPSNTDLTINSLVNLTGFPTSGAVQDDTIIESLTGIKMKTDKLGQYISGYFKALYNGKYRFYASGSGPIKLDITLDESTPSSKINLIDFNKSTSKGDIYTYADNITKTSNSRSDWTTTLTKGNYYFIEIYHVSKEGYNHLGIGVEIAQSDVNVTNQYISNQSTQVMKLEIKPKVTTRDLYEVLLPEADGDYTIYCKNKDLTTTTTYITSAIKVQNTADDFRKALSSASGENNIIVRKIPINENGQYFTGSPDDATYTHAKPFTSFVINLHSNINNEVLPIVNSGKKSGYAYLFFVDRVGSRNFNADCYINKESINKIYSIKQKQVGSDGLIGSYILSFTDPKTTIVVSTPPINVKSNKASLLSYLNAIPFLEDNVDIYGDAQVDPPVIKFSIRFKIDVRF